VKSTIDIFIYYRDAQHIQQVFQVTSFGLHPSHH